MKECRGSVVERIPCPQCGTSDWQGDNLVVFDDGHARCFHPDCNLFIPNVNENESIKTQPVTKKETKAMDFLPVSYVDLHKRGLTKETCEYYKYGVGVRHGKPCHVAQWYRDGELVGQKLRYPDKTFEIIGTCQGLWGAPVEYVKDRILVITEGEIDAMSVYQELYIPTVSLPCGSGSVKSALKASQELIDNADTILLFFDNDSAGHKATQEALSLLPPSKTLVAAEIPYKDANEALLAIDEASAIHKAYKEATAAPLPEGFKLVKPTEELLAEIMKSDGRGPSIFLPKLSTMLDGYPLDQLTLLFADTGKGKTTLVKELVYELISTHGKKVGGFFLEENEKSVFRSLVAMDNNISAKELRFSPDKLVAEQYLASYNKLKDKLVYFCDFSGDTYDILMTKLRHLIEVEKVDFIIYDNLTFTMQGSTGNNERKDIDRIIHTLSQIVNTYNVGVLVIAQITKADRKSFREPDIDGYHCLNMSDINGSGGPARTSFVVLSLDEHSSIANRRRITVHKNRIGSVVGNADDIVFDLETGRIQIYDPSTELHF